MQRFMQEDIKQHQPLLARVNRNKTRCYKALEATCDVSVQHPLTRICTTANVIESFVHHVLY